MEMYLNKVKIRSQQISSENGTTSGSSNQSKVISICIILGFSSQFLLDNVIPDTWKGQDYLVFKIFWNNLIFTVILPFVVVLKSNGLIKYCQQILENTKEIFNSLAIVKCIKKSFLMLHIFQNEISPQMADLKV